MGCDCRIFLEDSMSQVKIKVLECLLHTGLCLPERENREGVGVMTAEYSHTQDQGCLQPPSDNTDKLKPDIPGETLTLGIPPRMHGFTCLPPGTPTPNMFVWSNSCQLHCCGRGLDESKFCLPQPIQATSIFTH